MRATIRGRACPFNRMASLVSDDEFESVVPGAFADQVAAGKGVPIVSGGHDQPNMALTTKLFEGDDALYFEAILDFARWQHAALLSDIVRGSRTAASVRFINWTDNSTTKGGTIYRKVVRAEIDHIAVGIERGAFPQTLVWRADCDLDHAPFEVRAAAACWDVGHTTWQTRRASAEFERHFDAMARPILQQLAVAMKLSGLAGVRRSR